MLKQWERRLDRLGDYLADTTGAVEPGAAGPAPADSRTRTHDPPKETR